MSYGAVLSLNWKCVWVITNTNISGSLFKGWVIFCPCCACAERMKFLSPLVDVVESEGIGKVYCEVWREGWRALQCVWTRWSSAPTGFCGTWRGINEHAWSGGSQRMPLLPHPSRGKAPSRVLCLWAEQRGSAPSLAGSGGACVHQRETRGGLRRAAFWKGRLIHRELPPSATLIFGNAPVLL